jgi:hypothetical protein
VAGIDVDDVVLEPHPGQLVQEAGVGLLADGQDDGVGLELLEAAGAVRLAVLVELHHLDGELLADVGDGAQPVHLDALALGLLALLLVRRHLRGGAPVDHDGLLGAEPLGDPGGVHGGVAAAVDGDPASDHRLLAGADLVQEAHRVDHPGGIHVRDVDLLGQVGADRHEDGVEPALGLLLGQVGDVVVEHDLDAQVGQPADLGVEDLARQPVLGDAVAHHAAGSVAGVVDLDLVAHHRQVVGSGQSGRAGADDQHPVARADGRAGVGPALLDGQVSEVALHRVDRDGAVQVGAVAGHLAGVVADPAVDGGEGIVGGELAPRLLLLVGLDETQPLLDVLAGGAAGVAGGQHVEVHGAPGPDRRDAPGGGGQVGPGGEVLVVGRGEVPCRAGRGDRTHS